MEVHSDYPAHNGSISALLALIFQFRLIQFGIDVALKMLLNRRSGFCHNRDFLANCLRVSQLPALKMTVCALTYVSFPRSL